MYSMLLMTALSTGPQTAEFNGFFRDLFSFGGCSGSCSGSGTGSGAAAYAGSCTGCCGGGFGSRLRAFFAGGSSCHGSCSGRGSCSGSSSGSCYGSCTGQTFACSGGGCSGGFAPVPMGGGDGFAAPSPAMAFARPIDGCCGGGPLGVAPMPLGTSDLEAGVMPASPMPAGPPSSVPEDRTARRVSARMPTGGDRATVVVRLPADAKLYAEGRLLNLTSAERTFVTPPLPAGADYAYTFRAEYVRDGETISRSKQVPVRAGATATVEFTEGTAKAVRPPVEVARKPDPVPLQPAPPTVPVGTPWVVPPTAPTTAPKTTPAVSTGNPRPAAATDRARITVKLPPGATLYVDGRKNDRSEPVREFTTPPLRPGEEFAYLMKAEIVRDGRPEVTTTKVSFRAGETHTVDFTVAPGR